MKWMKHQWTQSEGFSKALRFLEKYKFFLLLMAVGMFLLLFSFSPAEEAEAMPETGMETSMFNLEEFEEKLGGVLSSIEGAGRVEIILSLHSTQEAVYAANVRTSSGSDKKNENYESNLTILNDRSYGESPVLVKEYYPKFKGALVVCDGADNPNVKFELAQAVGSVCGLTFSDISIIKMKN